MNRPGSSPHKRRKIGVAFYAALLFAAAIILIGMGGYLLFLGGSPYYALAGGAILLCSLLLWRGSPRAAPVYALVLIGTLAWSLWEVGTDGWGLVSRLAALIVLGLPLLGLWLGTRRRRLMPR